MAQISFALSRIREMESDEVAINRNNRKLRLYLKREMKTQNAPWLTRYGKKEREVNPRNRCQLTDLFATLESLLQEVLLRELRDRPSEERDRRAPHPNRIYGYPMVFTVRFVSQHFAGPECPKFLGRSFLCVAIKGPLKRRFQLATDSLLSSRSVQLHACRASPR